MAVAVAVAGGPAAGREAAVLGAAPVRGEPRWAHPGGLIQLRAVSSPPAAVPQPRHRASCEGWGRESLRRVPWRRVGN